MLFFDLAMYIVLAAMAVAVGVGTITLLTGLKREPVPVGDAGDCRETALIMHGEGARADCN